MTLALTAANESRQISAQRVVMGMIGDPISPTLEDAMLDVIERILRRFFQRVDETDANACSAGWSDCLADIEALRSCSGGGANNDACADDCQQVEAGLCDDARPAEATFESCRSSVSAERASVSHSSFGDFGQLEAEFPEVVSYPQLEKPG